MDTADNLIMLSYARHSDDEGLCIRIREALVELGYSVFMDLMNVDKKQLAQKLDSAACFIG